LTQGLAPPAGEAVGAAPWRGLEPAGGGTGLMDMDHPTRIATSGRRRAAGRRGSRLVVGCAAVAGLVAALAAAGAHQPSTGEAAPQRLEHARIEIAKADRRLRLFDGERLVATFPIGLGFEPVADKRRQGDGATPEGDYRVCVKNPQSQYLLSLGLDYPNPADAAAALERGAIDRAVHDRIVDAHRRGICPPWNTPLGGEIFIHGRGSSSDWTLGCVALDDPDIRMLFRVVPVGTTVRIAP
jgi:L,D-peptidoglycan transpeptidase YkuD (ErfK/YbiS/YcfS/YnhG family)